MTFKRTKEDFICEHCKRGVVGDGYTNHCPFCLWSRHVDKDPGDREEACRGMMEPWDIEPKNGGFRIIHKCTVCGFERPSPFRMDDSLDAFTEIARKSAKRREDSLR